MSYAVAYYRRSKGFPVVVALLCVTGCGAPGDASSDAAGQVVQVWAHSGQDAERDVLEAQVERFNQANAPLRVELSLIPEGAYDEQVQAAALAGDLPDVMELDGPFVASYAWRGHLMALDSLVTDSLLAALLPSIVEQGRYGDRLWALGAYDSGLGLFARRSMLDSAGIPVPDSPEEAWTADELEDWMLRLAEDDEDGAVLDLHLNYPGEWYTYAFAPVLYSAGGGLMDMERMRSTGTLDSQQSVGALTRIQTWIRRGWVDPNVDDAAFVEGRTPLSWSGHWDFERYRAAWGDDVVALPLPDFGDGTRTGQGSWVWAVTSNARDLEVAVSWIRFLLTPEEIRAMAGANSAIPARASAAAESPLYGPDGPLRVLFEQLRDGWSVTRPRTPAYPIITSAFQEAFDEVRSGGDVREALGVAAGLIDREIVDNREYPMLSDRR
jgi:multiple sugar transport system substrate-binding protein